MSSSKQVTLHHLIAAFLVVLLGLIFAGISHSAFGNSWPTSRFGQLLLVSALAGIYFVLYRLEAKLLKEEKYRNSLFMKPLSELRSKKRQ